MRDDLKQLSTQWVTRVVAMKVDFGVEERVCNRIYNEMYNGNMVSLEMGVPSLYFQPSIF